MKILVGLFLMILTIGVDLLMVRALADTWGWFVEPLVNVTISFWHMAGLYIFLTYFSITKKAVREVNSHTQKQEIEDTVNKGVIIAVTWGCAALVYYIMVT